MLCPVRTRAHLGAKLATASTKGQLLWHLGSVCCSVHCCSVVAVSTQAAASCLLLMPEVAAVAPGAGAGASWRAKRLAWARAHPAHNTLQWHQLRACSESLLSIDRRCSATIQASRVGVNLDCVRRNKHRHFDTQTRPCAHRHTHTNTYLRAYHLHSHTTTSSGINQRLSVINVELS